jgi:hypothetical protein
MSIKSILKSKTLYLAILVVVNAAVLISLCFVTFFKDESPQDFIPNGKTTFQPTTTSRYAIQTTDFSTYDIYNAAVIEKADMYHKYTLDSTNVTIGEEMKKNGVIGTYSGLDVLCSSDAICIDLTTLEGVITVTVYNYNAFQITASLTTEEYTKADFNNQQSIFLNGNGSNYDVVFLGYDYDYLESQSIICAFFAPVDCDSFINANSVVTIKSLDKVYKDQMCLPAIVFGNVICSKSFYLVSNDTYEKIYVDAFIIMDEYALIKSSSPLLYGGMYLYLYDE